VSDGFVMPDTEEVTGSNPVRPTPFFENLSSVWNPDGSQAPAVSPNKRWSQPWHSGLCIGVPSGLHMVWA